MAGVPTVAVLKPGMSARSKKKAAGRKLASVPLEEYPWFEQAGMCMIS